MLSAPTCVFSPIVFYVYRKTGGQSLNPTKTTEKNNCPVGTKILGQMLIQAAKGSVLAENTWEAIIKLENIETT